MQAEVARLRAQVKTLQAQLFQTSANSHKPPSSDPPSRAGSEFAERLLPVMATLRQQRRNVLDYVTTACEAILHHHPAPSLLPQIETTLDEGLRKAA